MLELRPQRKGRWWRERWRFFSLDPGRADPATAVPPRQEDGGQAEGEDGERGGGEVDCGGWGGGHARLRALSWDGDGSELGFMCFGCLPGRIWIGEERCCLVCLHGVVEVDTEPFLIPMDRSSARGF